MDDDSLIEGAMLCATIDAHAIRLREWHESFQQLEFLVNQVAKLQRAGVIFTRRQVENMSWPPGTRIEWLPARQPSPAERIARLEQRLAALEAWLDRL